MDEWLDPTLRALAQVGFLSLVVERVFAFVFENFVPDPKTDAPAPPPNTPALPNAPASASGFTQRRALKAGSVAILSISVCWCWGVDVMGTISKPGERAVTDWVARFGYVVTGLVVAGGSAGVVGIVQGYLGLSKSVRDASIEAKRQRYDAATMSDKRASAAMEAEIAKAQAEADKARAEAEKAKAEAAEVKRRAGLTA